MTLEVVTTAGKDTWLDAGRWDILGGALVLYHPQTKRVIAAYGPHHWIKARWAEPCPHGTDGEERQKDDDGRA